jgi:signal transduction histidine kinase
MGGRASARPLLAPSAFDARLPYRHARSHVGPPTGDASLRLHTDVLKLRQILVELLTNAVKFTDEGRVTIGAHADGDDAVCFVRDTGIGIAPANQESVFQPFWQVEQTASRRVGGTGLGLSVTRRLARLLGGEVTVERAPGQGSTFFVRLPRAPRAEP